MGKFQAVVFDLDGVIVDTARFHYLAWKKILKEHFGVEHTIEVDEKTKGIGRYACMQLILSEYNISASEEQARQIADEKNAYYVHLLQTELKESDILPGISEALAWLREHHVPTALASSSYNAPLVIEKLGLQFDFVVNPAEIKNGKPAPDIYRKAAENLGLPSEKCIGVEDAASGVESVTSAGLFCIGIGSRELLQKSDCIIDSTEELLAVLMELFSDEKDWKRGFTLPFDLHSGWSAGEATTCRRLSQMWKMYQNRDETERILETNDPVIYEFYELGAPENPGELSFGTTVVYPGDVGGEFYMTKGHFHNDLMTAEVYLGLSGSGLLVMESQEGDTRELKISPGEVVYVPRGYAHRTVNTGTEPLVCFFAFQAAAGHDYGTIETKGFHHIIMSDEKQGWRIVENKNWRKEE